MTANLFTAEIEPCTDGYGVSIEDFRAYMPTRVYIYMPCCELWSGASINSRLPRVPVLAEQRPAEARQEAASRSLWRQAPGSTGTGRSSR